MDYFIIIIGNIKGILSFLNYFLCLVFILLIAFSIPFYISEKDRHNELKSLILKHQLIILKVVSIMLIIVVLNILCPKKYELESMNNNYYKQEIERLRTENHELQLKCY